MDTLKLSDSKLATLHHEVTLELRRRSAAAHLDDLSIIRGNEMGKRALTVALAGGHSILFIGPPNSGKSMFRAASRGLVAFEARPCPCGHFGSPRRSCNCTESAITRHRAKTPAADITVEVCEPAQRDLESTRLGTSSADVSAALVGLPSYASLDLGEESRVLLRCGCTELAIDAHGRERILAVARTIANLDRCETIRTIHLNEAINYRSFRR